MMEKTRKLLIVGDSSFAEVAYEYFTRDSCYTVTAFCVEKAYLKHSQLLGIPVYPLEDITAQFSPETHDVFVAVVYSQLNRLRARLCAVAKARGYALASFISPRTFVWSNVKFGEHCFVFEDNTIQPFVEIGNNVVLWSGNHIGHHSRIEDNCFVSSHVVVSGHSVVGRNTFLGVNATIGNNVSVGEDNWIGPGVTLSSDTGPDELYRLDKPKPSPIGAKKFFKVKG